MTIGSFLISNLPPNFPYVWNQHCWASKELYRFPKKREIQTGVMDICSVSTESGMEFRTTFQRLSGSCCEKYKNLSQSYHWQCKAHIETVCHNYCCYWNWSHTKQPSASTHWRLSGRTAPTNRGQTGITLAIQHSTLSVYVVWMADSICTQMVMSEM